MRRCFRRTYILIRASFLLGSGSGHQSKVADDLLRVLGLSGTRLSAAAPQATQQSTATGLDELPAWIIKLAAPVFCEPITRLFNRSIAMSLSCPFSVESSIHTPSTQGFRSSIPFQLLYRPISITPILSRIMEKLIVRQFLYPTFSAPPSTLNFSNQFAFRPTGSTTAALIYIFHNVTQLLAT